MHINRSWIAVLALLAALPVLTIGVRAAQQQGGEMQGPRGESPRRGPMSADDRIKQMTKDFNLTADQQTKIKQLFVDAEKKMQDLRTSAGGDQHPMRAKMMQLMKDTNEKVRAQLDDKQKEKFDKQQEERMQRMQERRGGGMREPGEDNPGPPPPPPQN